MAVCKVQTLNALTIKYHDRKDLEPFPVAGFPFPEDQPSCTGTMGILVYTFLSSMVVFKNQSVMGVLSRKYYIFQ